MKTMNSVVMILSSSILLGLFSIGSFHTAFADFELSKPYVLGGGGYAITDISVENSRIELSFFTGDQIGSKINMEINDGSIMFEEKDFLFKQFDGDILREGRFLRLVGLAEDTQGDQISLRFFGKLLAKSTDELVYELRGTLERSGEKYSLHYITKSALEVVPQVTEMEEPDQIADVQPIVERKTKTQIELDVTHYLRVRTQSEFIFTVKVYEVSLDGIVRADSLAGAKITADVFDSLNNNIKHFEGITSEKGFSNKLKSNSFSDKFYVRYGVPLGTYTMKISALYGGAFDEKEILFHVLERQDRQ